MENETELMFFHELADVRLCHFHPKIQPSLAQVNMVFLFLRRCVKE